MSATGGGCFPQRRRVGRSFCGPTTSLTTNSGVKPKNLEASWEKLNWQLCLRKSNLPVSDFTHRFHITRSDKHPTVPQRVQQNFVFRYRFHLFHSNHLCFIRSQKFWFRYSQRFTEPVATRSLDNLLLGPTAQHPADVLCVASFLSSLR